MADVYDPGTLLRLYCTFKDGDGAEADPDDVSGAYLDPLGATTQYDYGVDAELVKESTGVYYIEITPSTPGTWFFRFVGEGTVDVSAEAFFDIRKPKVTIT